MKSQAQRDFVALIPRNAMLLPKTELGKATEAAP